ncbi:GNAT family N-acetyltransferase [Ureibacillus chungkukjangi]|uniref:GNAT family N-acetyltransferase n=1 Tax=Ureibacillus chungkukjangi TaxID=1202712 RepID=UPI00384C729C
MEYNIFESIPDKNILNEILNLHGAIFGYSDDLINKMSSKSKLLIITARDGERVVGYKMGYEITNDKFYSWLGGVNPLYRNQGIAASLMEMQHRYLKNSGYYIVQTKTMNKWRGMLILNIKNGFEIIETYTDENGLHKIVLEKNLQTFMEEE